MTERQQRVYTMMTERQQRVYTMMTERQQRVYTMMTERQQRVCIWAGITFAPLFFVGFWVFAGFIPPPSPGMSAEAVARMFAEGRGRIRTGLWIATAAAPFLAFFVAALTHQIRRIGGSESPLATAQLIAGSCLILEFIFPQLVWQTAAYRSERSPEM